jgi:hypothetical protein
MLIATDDEASVEFPWLRPFGMDLGVHLPFGIWRFFLLAAAVAAYPGSVVCLAGFVFLGQLWFWLIAAALNLVAAASVAALLTAAVRPHLDEDRTVRWYLKQWHDEAHAPRPATGSAVHMLTLSAGMFADRELPQRHVLAFEPRIWSKN